MLSLGETQHHSTPPPPQGSKLVGSSSSSVQRSVFPEPDGDRLYSAPLWRGVGTKAPGTDLLSQLTVAVNTTFPVSLCAILPDIGRELFSEKNTV